MARPNTGEVTERPWSDGKTITFGARVYAYGRRHRLAFGTNIQGWNTTRAEIELDSIQQQIARGTWVPPEKRTTVKPKKAIDSDARQSFGVFARQVIEAKKSHGLDEDTIEDLDWRMGHLLGYFEAMELVEIDVAQVDRFRDGLAQRSRIIREAAARGKPLMVTIKQPGRRPYERPKRPLSNSSINKILALLSRIMQRAVDYRHVQLNPLKVGAHKDRYLPEAKPKRTFLEVDELHALLDAAGELDQAKRLDHRTGRRPALAALTLAGFRISELCDLLCPQVDLARDRFKVPDAKTPKGIREVEMTTFLRREAGRHHEQRVRDGLPMNAESHFYGIKTGGRRDPNNFRKEVLNPAVTRANKNRAEQGLPPLPAITPHSLRRTWAMLAAQAGRDPHWISDQIGHDSAAFTMQVYQQTRNRRLSTEERQAIWELMRFADEPTECPFARQATRSAAENVKPKAVY
jgi:integrase